MVVSIKILARIKHESYNASDGAVKHTGPIINSK